MRLGITLLRVVIGALFMGHGLQKLLGWFGGYGLEATGGAFEGMGLRPGKVHATAAGIAETAGGALMVAGKVTPLASAMITGTMTTAIEKVHLEKGVWNQEGGFEYPVVLTAAAFAVAAEEGIGWALGALGAGVAGGIAASRISPPQKDATTERFAREEETAAQPAGATG
jgi:putative oxidoreductase